MEKILSIDLNNINYKIIKNYCTDIESDYSMVAKTFIGKKIKGSNSKYLSDMRIAQEYSLLTNNKRTGFVYIMEYSNNGYNEVRTLFIIDNKNRINSVILLSWLLSIEPNTIRVYPHTDDISMWSSVATKLSMVRWHQGINNYITIKLDEPKAKRLKLLGIKIEGK